MTIYPIGDSTVPIISYTSEPTIHKLMSTYQNEPHMKLIQYVGNKNFLQKLKTGKLEICLDSTKLKDKNNVNVTPEQPLVGDMDDESYDVSKIPIDD